MTSLYTQLISGILFPLHERLKGHETVAVRKEMETSQWLPADSLRELQVQNLRRFLVDVGRCVPCYRDLFREQGFDPRKINSLEDIQQLPLIGKPFIRANQELLKADNAMGLSRFNTGGSSGEPLIFYIGKERVSHDVAAKWRATRWWGVDIGDPEIVVWGSPIELGAQDRVRHIRDKIIRTRLLPAFEMSERKLDGFIQEIRKVSPKMLFGYPSALSLIAAHAEARGIGMDDLGLKVAFVTSERLYDHQKEKIETVFGCRVANGYGGRDAGFIAHQCPQGGMHLTAEDIIVEIIDKEGKVLPNGEAGEIVVTHLATRDFPFIRYRTGDIGVLSDEACPCGRGLPLLKEIQGRATDFIVAQDGTVLHGLALIYTLRDLPGIKEFKIIQESLERTRVEIVKDEGYRPDCETVIKEEFKKRLGQSVQIDIEYLQGIEPEKSGKFRYVVSDVDVLS
jgi:phenylacetate-CoA ligase